ncbi:MAG: globin [Bacteroidales bacterium]
MELIISPMPDSTLPEVQLPDKRFLQLLGEPGIRKLISDHYNLLRISNIKSLFPTDDIGLEQAKKNSSDFFIQLMGGHPYFNENRGKPMLAQRHLAFRITPEARLVWLECFREALKTISIDDEILESFWNYLNLLSMRMVNTKEDKPTFVFNFKK